MSTKSGEANFSAEGEATSADAAAVREFLELFAETATSVFSQAFAAEWHVSTAPIDAVTTSAGGTASSAEAHTAPALPQAEDVWLVFESADALTGEIAFRVAPAQAARLAQLFLGKSGSAESSIQLNDEQRECVAELFRQLCGQFATALKPSRGEVGFKETSATSQGIPGVSGKKIIVSGNSETLWFDIYLSTELTAALQAQTASSTPDASAAPNPTPASDATPPAGVSAKEAQPSMPSTRVGDKDESRNLDLLLGIELRAMLRFGQRRMPLREVLQLNSGSVVDLDRRVEEPVELLVDENVIARGEVVVIDGNYGLRIVEIGAASGN